MNADMEIDKQVNEGHINFISSSVDFWGEKTLNKQLPFKYTKNLIPGGWILLRIKHFFSWYLIKQKKTFWKDAVISVFKIKNNERGKIYSKILQDATPTPLCHLRVIPLLYLHWMKFFFWKRKKKYNKDEFIWTYIVEWFNYKTFQSDALGHIMQTVQGKEDIMWIEY